MKLSEMREALNLNAGKRGLEDLTACNVEFAEGILIDLPRSIATRIAPDVRRLIQQAAIGEVAEIDSRLKALGAEPDEPKAAAPVSADEESERTNP